jgi:hypothetical protein
MPKVAVTNGMGLKQILLDNNLFGKIKKSNQINNKIPLLIDEDKLKGVIGIIEIINDNIRIFIVNDDIYKNIEKYDITMKKGNDNEILFFLNK